jgi:hypothetical protein
MEKSLRGIRWRAPEFLYRKKTLLWYTNVCVFFFVVILLLVLAQNWLGIGVVAIIFWFFLARADLHPKTIDYRVAPDGVYVGEHKVALSDISSFSVDDAGRWTVITLNPEIIFASPVTLIVNRAIADKVVDRLNDRLPVNNRFSLMRWVYQTLRY